MNLSATRPSPLVPSPRVWGFGITLLFVLACMSLANLLAQSTSGFVGTWVEDQSKRQIGGQEILRFREGPNGLEELRGQLSRPVVQPVRFDGKPYAVEGGNTIVWKQLDATHFERTISSTRPGADKNETLSTRRIEVSADGATLTEVTERTQNGKKTTETIVHRRMSGKGSDLIGEWRVQARKSDVPQTFRIESAGVGLRAIQNEQSTNRATFALTFDGKPAPIEGPNVIPGNMGTSKLVNDHLIESVYTRQGTPGQRNTWSLSQDGKT